MTSPVNLLEALPLVPAVNVVWMLPLVGMQQLAVNVNPVSTEVPVTLSRLCSTLTVPSTTRLEVPSVIVRVLGVKTVLSIRDDVARIPFIVILLRAPPVNEIVVPPPTVVPV